MTLSLTANPLPLQLDEKGVIRVKGTRLTLDSIIVAFKLGATPPEITEQFPIISLADVYTVLGYYLNNQAEIEAYLAERQAKADETRQKIEAKFDHSNLREKLEARL
jgi:uncharacterized protein (DUF433 family)